jgi:hypothetical protein
MLTEQQQRISALQNRLGINQQALKASFITLWENEVPDEQLMLKLVDIAMGCIG